MALVSNPRSRRPRAARLTPAGGPRRRSRARYLVAALLALVIAAAAGAALALSSAHAGLAPDPDALARVTLPLGGGRVESVSATTGPHSRSVAVALRGSRIWPVGPVDAGERLSLEVTVVRPGWIGWLTGKREHLHLSLVTPAAGLRAQYVTVRAGAPLRIRFSQPVTQVLYGTAGHLRRIALGSPQTSVTLPHQAIAGTMLVAGFPRNWERGAPRSLSWFPAGTAASVVASPAPGTTIKPGTPITLTFNKPVSRVLGGSLPPVVPATPGAWHSLSSHAIVFQPSGYGYGMGATVTVPLPHGVMVAGGQQGTSASAASWHVPPGSTLRLQELLSLLNYLPLHFAYRGSGVELTPAAQEQAAVDPPAGTFSWRYANTPDALRSAWSAGSDGVITRGAVMAFENDHGLAADGSAGPMVWRALISAVLSGHRSSFGYTFVSVDKGAQRLSLWHNGQTVLSTAVNTGIAQAPTASGTFPVYEHLRVTTMSGTNPDGSKYHDPGIQFVSYFNGGDALHAFTRAQYGFPQSLGCVEMALGPAGQVWPYTPIGTLVHVA